MIDKVETEAAERALIGAWLMDPMRVGMVLQRLKVRGAWWRGDRTRRELAELLLVMTQENAAIDELTVLDRMKRAEELDPVALAAAPGEMERCVDACPSASHAEYYAAILRREYMAAQIKKAFSSLAAQLDTTDPEMVASETAEQMRAVLDDNEVAQELSVEKVLDDQVKKWRQAAVDRVAGKKVEIGVPMPWWRLTKMLGGLPNDLVVLAARPSVGKTAMEGEIRTCVAAHGFHTLSMLMDMGAERVLPRDLCRDGGVSMPKLKFGFARHDQLDAMEAAAKGLGALPMHFCTRTTRMEMMAMRARHLKAQGKLSLITVDHCQLVTYAGSERHDMRQIVTRVTSFFKSLAQELGVPVLLLSQLRRCEPGQQEREPELDDLRDSGSLEQDAAIVMFLHRDLKQVRTWQKEGDEEAIKDKKRPIKLMVKKNQDGGLGTVKLLMKPHYFTFDLADDEYRPMRDDDPLRDAERE
jgi:replicative DNA helicase